jgi:hypothetical protein
VGARDDLDFFAEKYVVPCRESNPEFAVLQLVAESRCLAMFQSKLETKK